MSMCWVLQGWDLSCKASWEIEKESEGKSASLVLRSESSIKTNWQSYWEVNNPFSSWSYIQRGLGGAGRTPLLLDAHAEATNATATAPHIKLLWNMVRIHANIQSILGSCWRVRKDGTRDWLVAQCSLCSYVVGILNRYGKSLVVSLHSYCHPWTWTLGSEPSFLHKENEPWRQNQGTCWTVIPVYPYSPANHSWEQDCITTTQCQQNQETNKGLVVERVKGQRGPDLDSSHQRHH